MSKDINALETFLSSKLEKREVNLMLRLGRLRARGQASKHLGGYRDYEIRNNYVSEQDIWISREKLIALDLATDKRIEKYWDDGRRQVVTLTDITPLGLCMYFNIMSERSVLQDIELRTLHGLISEEKIAFKSLSSDAMIAYLSYFNMLPSDDEEGAAGLVIAGGTLSEDEREKSEAQLQILKDAVDGIDRQKISNFQINQLYDLVDRISKENRAAKPRRGYIILILKIIRDVLAVSAGIVSAVLAYLALLK